MAWEPNVNVAEVEFYNDDILSDVEKTPKQDSQSSFKGVKPNWDSYYPDLKLPGLAH